MGEHISDAIHNQMLGAMTLFNRAVRVGDGPAAAYWYERYLAFWDCYEDLGGGMSIPLPARDPPKGYLMCWPTTPIQWGATFEEPRRCA